MSEDTGEFVFSDTGQMFDASDLAERSIFDSGPPSFEVSPPQASYDDVLMDGIAPPTAFNVITSHVGERDGRPHEGLDIRAREGTPIMSFRGGIVREVQRDFQRGKGPGKFVVIESPDTGELFKYFHLSDIDDDIEVGTELATGESFAKAGNTGRSFGSHLHFEIHTQDEAGEYQPRSPIELYPDHFKNYIDKQTNKPVNIESILKQHTRTHSH